MKEKQIEEMAEKLEIIANAREEYANDVTDHTENEYIREALLNAGYRKQSEGENITENHPVDEFVCEKCGAIFRDVPRIVIDEDDGDEYYYEFEFKFCPRCGMKVKGGDTDA